MNRKVKPLVIELEADATIGNALSSSDEALLDEFFTLLASIALRELTNQSPQRHNCDVNNIKGD
jgi:hypothetical protein